MGAQRPLIKAWTDAHFTVNYNKIVYVAICKRGTPEVPATLRPPAMFGKICLLLNKTKSTSIHAERQWSVKTLAVELCWFKTMNASQHNTYKSSRATECDVQSDHKHKPTPFVLLNGFCFEFLLKEQILAN